MDTQSRSPLVRPPGLADPQVSAKHQIDVSAEISKLQSASSDAFLDGLRKLTAYECWEPIKQTFSTASSNPVFNNLEVMSVLADVMLNRIGLVSETLELLGIKISENSWKYQDVKDRMIFICAPSNPAKEAAILSGVWNHFCSKRDQIESLERLCHLYEKKLYDENKLNFYYQKLLHEDPENIKALRHFKLISSQSNDWDEVARILLKLIEVSQKKHEVFRLGQELAAVYVYQLGEPANAIEVLESFCSGSPLDSSNIYYDAYEGLGDWSGCLRVLESYIQNISNPKMRSVVCFKIAMAHKKLGHQTEALDVLAKAIELNPDFYEAQEELISLLVTAREWPAVMNQLKDLQNTLKDSELISQIDATVLRIEDGLRKKSG